MTQNHWRTPGLRFRQPRWTRIIKLTLAFSGIPPSTSCLHSSTRPRVPVSVVAPSSANASGPPDTSTSLADGGSGHADTTNSCPTRAASVRNVRDYAVRFVNWRDRHCLCRRDRGQGQGGQSDQSDHRLSPLFATVCRRRGCSGNRLHSLQLVGKLVDKIPINLININTPSFSRGNGCDPWLGALDLCQIGQ